MRATDQKPTMKTSACELRRRLGAQGVPIVLGRTLSSDDDPEIDPASLLSPGVHDIAGRGFPDYPAALSFALASACAAEGARPTLICETESAAFDHGALYGPGLKWLGLDPARIVIVRTKNEGDLLWSAEEALGCGELGAVVIRLPARGKKYDFTASRRLHLRALANKTPAYVVRGRHEREASAAETLWRLSPEPSLPSPHASKRILGLARWRAALERARTSRPKDWVMAWDHETHHLHLVEPLGDRPLLSRAS